MAQWYARPPWNYDLMAAGFLLALVPSLGIAVGLVAAIRGLIRQPRAEWFLLFGVAGGLAVAMLFQYLRYPYYGHGKAFYALAGMVSLCALGAWGLDELARIGRWPGLLLAILVGAWAGTSYASYWVLPDSPATYNWVGIRNAMLGHPAEAEAGFKKALALEPHSVPANLQMGLFCLQLKRADLARPLLENVLHREPNNPFALFGLAVVLQIERRKSEALECLQRVGELAPDYPFVFSMLGGLLMEENRLPEAITAYRQALRITTAFSPADHANLALLLARTGQTEESLAQYRQALRLHPNYPVFLADLAWMLSTTPDERFRKPEEAGRLAEEACRRSEYREARPLQVLAAALAGQGRYSDATSTAKRALQAAEHSGQTDLAAQIQEQLRSYEQGKIFRPGAVFRTIPYLPVPPRAVVDMG
jgi:tetratricopeptide (TPR) repeat protein